MAKELKMLVIEDIQVDFDGTPVLERLTCHVHKGDFVVVQGGTGSGKTTLFDIITGRQKPKCGRVLIDGADVTGMSERHRAGLIGRVSQNTMQGCFPSMTVEENMIIASTKNRASGIKIPRHSPRESLNGLFQPLGIDPRVLLGKPMGLLSGGQRQLVTFCMVVLSRPKILLLDEPTAALDSLSADRLMKAAEEYINSYSITTLLITHDDVLASRTGNRRWRMRAGGIDERMKDEG